MTDGSQPEIDPVNLQVQADEILQQLNEKLQVKFQFAKAQQELQQLRLDHEDMEEQNERLRSELRERDGRITEGTAHNEKLIENLNQLKRENESLARRVTELTSVGEADHGGGEDIEFTDPIHGPMIDSV